MYIKKQPHQKIKSLQNFSQECNYCHKKVRCLEIVSHCIARHNTVDWNTKSQIEINRMLILLKKHYLLESKTKEYMAQWESCIKECGLANWSENDMKYKYLEHYFTVHWPCEKCSRCDTILPAIFIKIHVELGCDNV